CSPHMAEESLTPSSRRSRPVEPGARPRSIRNRTTAFNHLVSTINLGGGPSHKQVLNNDRCAAASGRGRSAPIRLNGIHTILQTPTLTRRAHDDPKTRFHSQAPAL